SSLCKESLGFFFFTRNHRGPFFSFLLFFSKKKMALDISYLEKTHRFRFAKHLVFHKSLLQKDIVLEKTKTPRMLTLGTQFLKEIQEGYTPPCEVRKISQDVGLGLFASSFVKKGSFIGEYTGLICCSDNYYKMKDYLFHYPAKTKQG